MSEPAKHERAGVRAEAVESARSGGGRHVHGQQRAPAVTGASCGGPGHADAGMLLVSSELRVAPAATGTSSSHAGRARAAARRPCVDESTSSGHKQQAGWERAAAAAPAASGRVPRRHERVAAGTGMSSSRRRVGRASATLCASSSRDGNEQEKPRRPRVGVSRGAGGHAPGELLGWLELELHRPRRHESTVRQI
nr:uncharacterized protein LOC120976852 [Aegilops tauschii subsp. strangulata]